MSTGKRVPGWGDLFYAVCWRLSDEPVQIVEIKTAMVVLWLDAVGPHPDIGEDSPVMGKLLGAIHSDGDTRSDWGRFLALLVMVAIKRKDVALAWRAGHELLQIKEQAERSARSKKGTGDQLNKWIAAYLLDHPGATMPDIRSAIESSATCQADPVLADYDPDTETLSYQPSPDREGLKDITRSSLERRIHRVRQTFAG